MPLPITGYVTFYVTGLPVYLPFTVRSRWFPTTPLRFFGPTTRLRVTRYTLRLLLQFVPRLVTVPGGSHITPTPVTCYSTTVTFTLPAFTVRGLQFIITVRTLWLRVVGLRLRFPFTFVWVYGLVRSPPHIATHHALFAVGWFVDYTTRSVLVGSSLHTFCLYGLYVGSFVVFLPRVSHSPVTILHTPHCHG